MTIDHLHALPLGTHLEEFRLDAQLGAGGFGITYRAHDELLDKVVAIKEYLPRDFATRTAGNTVAPISDADARDYQWGLTRFLDEARTLARFKHPHLNQVYRFFESNGTAYMVLEYVHGETLADRLSREPFLEEADLQRVLDEVLSGLGVMHEAGYVHRDIKPGNLMLREEDGSAVVLDFGAARQAVGQRSKPITSILTPGYAPVEQYDGKVDRVGAWTDIYALGMVAYRCISGLGDSELPDAVARMLAHTRREAVLLPAIEAGKGRYSPKLLEAIDWAMEVNEHDRPQSVDAWRQALTGGTRRKSPTKSVRKPATQPTRGTTTERTGTRWSSVALTLVIVVGALLGAGAWWGWQAYPEWFGQGPGGSPPVVKQEAPVEIETVTPDATETGELERKRQEALERELVGEMVSIPAGTFRMGDLSDEGDDDERPVHSVEVPAFNMGKHEVTFTQWDTCVADGGCGRYRPDDEGWGRGNRPVINVSWDDAQGYIDWLNDKTGGNFRLPSEAEWEYAARAGSTTKYHYGNSESQLCRYANHADSSTDIDWRNKACSDGVGIGTAAVGSYQPNSYGLYDMHGNVWEWTEDCWNDSYAGAPSDGSAWELGGCGRRVLRGGSWYFLPWYLRSAGRFWNTRSYRFHSVGFRLAQDK